MIAVVVVGALLVVGCWVWFELARVTAVVSDDRHVLRALRTGLKVAGRQFALLAALVLGVLAVRAALGVGADALLSLFSFSWWLPALVIQQVVQILAVGLALARRAGQVELALRTFPPAVPGDEVAMPQSPDVIGADG